MYEWLSHMKDHYRTNNLLIPMGGDFFFKNAHKIFINTDKLITLFNENYKDFKLVYSTPGQYLKAVHESGVKFPVKYGDQMPYSEKAFSYWSGYFSSRPVSKGNIRELDRYVSLMNNQWASAVLNEKTPKELKEKILSESEKALRIVGVMQHHDAVTGTERQHVADDYQDQIDSVYETSTKLNSEVIKNFIKTETRKDNIDDVIYCNKSQDKFIDCPDQLFGLKDNTYIWSEKSSSDAIFRLNLPSGDFKIIDPLLSQDIPQTIRCRDKND